MMFDTVWRQIELQAVLLKGLPSGNIGDDTLQTLAPFVGPTNSLKSVFSGANHSAKIAS